MFTCPYCGATARTRTSRRLSEFTVRQYHQCQNLECSAAFTTLNAFEKMTSQRSNSASAQGGAAREFSSPGAGVFRHPGKTHH